jgi:hypothetical protein
MRAQAHGLLLAAHKLAAVSRLLRADVALRLDATLPLRPAARCVLLQVPQLLYLLLGALARFLRRDVEVRARRRQT